MIDGGAESGRGNGASSDGDENDQKTFSSGDDFGSAIARIAVAQICDSVGFQRFQKSALEAISDIGIRYMREIGRLARSHANHAGRTTCNVFDIVQGLEDLSLSHGFFGASDVSRCLACSGVVRDIELYVRFAEEIPFARPVPRFPVIRNRKRRLSFAQIGEAPRGRHIPSWLPAFPNSSSCTCAKAPNEKSCDSADEIEQVRKNKNGERLMLSCSQLFPGNCIDNPTITEKGGDNVKKKEALPPYSNGMITRNGLSRVEIFVPELEAESTVLCNLDENDKRVLPQKRSPVNFRFQTKRKALAALSKLSSSETNIKKRCSWFSMNDEDGWKNVGQEVQEAENGPKQ